MNNPLRLVISLGICYLVSIIGGVFTTSSVSEWYPLLNKPYFNPPNWVFGPVWFLLYTIMGIAFFIIWIKKSKLKKNNKENKLINFAIYLFVIQLILNLFWSIIFFGFKNIFFAMIEIIILWIFILLTTIYFFKIKRIAGGLLLPYLLWVSFAVLLNIFIFLLN